MLQQNNNNNYVCLDMAHRELLQGCSRTSTPLSFGAIGFGAIPLIKGLRAWAVSSGFTARNRRKSVGENHSHQPDRHRGWKTKENLASFRTPGALVTVATLKGSEGVRQTQTRCLFLKAEGCSYLCTVGNNRATGPRAAGQRMHPKLAEGTSRGRRVTQDDAGVCEVKPQVIRKWRKSSKVGKSTEKSSVPERRDGVAPLKLDQGPVVKGDSFISETDAQGEAPSATSDCAITQRLKAKHKHALCTVQSGSVIKDSGVNDADKTHLHEMIREPDAAVESMYGISGNAKVYIGVAMTSPYKDSLDVATTSSKHMGQLVAEPTMNLNHNAKSKGVHFASAVPKFKDFSLESEDLMQVNNSKNGSAEVEQNINQATGETCLLNGPRNQTDGTLFIDTEEKQESKAIAGEELGGTEEPVVLIYSESLVMTNINMAKSPKQNSNDGCDLYSVISPSKVRLGNVKNVNDHPISGIEEDKCEALDVAEIMNTVDKCDHAGEESRYKVRVDQDLVGVENSQSEAPKARVDPELIEGEIENSMVPKARMDQDLVEGENGQSEVVLHCLQIKKEESPVDFCAKKLKKYQAEGVLGSKEIEKDKVEAFDMLRTKSLIKDHCQDLKTAKVESRPKSGMDVDCIKVENGQSEGAFHSLQIEKCEDGVLDMVSARSPAEDHGQAHDLTGMHEIKKENGRIEIAMGSLQIKKDEVLDSPNGDGGQGRTGPLGEDCLPQKVKEVNSGLEEQRLAKSPSRGPLKASIAVSIACLPNPAFPGTSNSTTAIATAPPSLGRQEEVEAGFTSLRPQAGSQLLSYQERGQDWSKVATNERPVEVGEEEEDEFGVFMQAGEEQVWTEEFNGLQQVPSGTHVGIAGHRSTTDANDPMSWTSDWTGVQSVHQPDDSWAAFKQEDESKEAEPEVSSDGQWWSSTVVKNTKLTLSSLHNVSSVFLAAFPSVETSSGDVDYVPTLRELLQKPAGNNRAIKPQNQSLLDGLQDLDRMIDVKYKRAESLSRKLLLQSLHLGAVSSERVSSRKQATSRFSPNLPTSNQQLAANAKRRLSYDINRNITA